MSALTTVESQRMAEGLKRRSRIAISVTPRISWSTSSGPRRRVSLRRVDSSSTGAESGIRQKRRKCRSRRPRGSALVVPAHALLDQHQAQVGVHGDGGPADNAEWALQLCCLPVPVSLERSKRASIGELVDLIEMR